MKELHLKLIVAMFRMLRPVRRLSARIQRSGGWESYALLSACLFLAIAARCFAKELPAGTKDCSGASFQSCFESREGDFRYPSRPFILFHAVPAKRAALLVHGLTDSPFYMKDVAKSLYDQGYDVYAILLAGHGTDAADLRAVKLETWEKQVADAIELLRGRSEQLVLGGFSTGGALVSEYAMTHRGEAVKAVLLFSPAIEMAASKAPMSCFVRDFKPWAADEDAVENNPSRYNRMPTNAVCQLYILSLKVRMLGGKRLKTAMFSVVSEYDQTVSVPAMLSFTAQASNPLNRRVVIARLGTAEQAIPGATLIPSTQPIRHADVPIDTDSFNGRSNPAFPEIRSLLSVFLAEAVGS